MALTDLINKMVRPLALTGMLYSCGGGTNNYYGDGQGNGNSGGDICQEYQDMCPFEYEGKTGRKTNKPWPEYNDCMNYCGGDWEISDVEEVREMCSFITCAIETGYCDNQVRGDPQVETCQQEHGWK